MRTGDYLCIGVLLILLGGTGFLGYQYYTLSQTLSTTTEDLVSARETIDTLQNDLSEMTEARNNLQERYDAEREKMEAFEDQIDEITGTVGTLDKLARIDPELLQKYSKVYFLNEHYQPSDLDTIPEEYTYDESRDYYFHDKVLPFLEDMLDAAEDDGIDLWVASAFRSFDEQADLKGHYTVQYGSGANTFSADQGYSEHQLGTTVDFTTAGLNGGITGFQNTEAYQWLVDNAHKYGFVLSYPEGNQFYVFEPWHWRFVGEDLADDLHDDDAHFYDLSQRDIDEYLVNFFDG